MEKSNYNKTSGRKTLILVIVLIAIILFLTIYAVFLAVRKSSVITGSSYYEVPTPTPTEVPTPAPTIFIRPLHGD
jgi:flagellar basal body-associated protein FliL